MKSSWNYGGDLKQEHDRRSIVWWHGHSAQGIRYEGGRIIKEKGGLHLYSQTKE